MRAGNEGNACVLHMLASFRPCIHVCCCCPRATPVVLPPRSLADLLRTPELHPSLRRAIVMALDAAKAMTYLHAHMCAFPSILLCRR